MIKDRIALGIFAGLTGGMTAVSVQYGLYKLGFSNKSWLGKASGATVSKAFHSNPDSVPLGLLTSLTLSILGGITQVYLLSVTGKDYRILKAGGLAILSWLGIHGLGSRVTYNFDPADSPPKSSGVSLLCNLIDYTVASEFVAMVGDERLFDVSITPHPLAQEDGCSSEYYQPDRIHSSEEVGL